MACQPIKNYHSSTIFLRSTTQEKKNLESNFAFPFFILRSYVSSIWFSYPLRHNGSYNFVFVFLLYFYYNCLSYRCFSVTVVIIASVCVLLSKLGKFILNKYKTESHYHNELIYKFLCRHFSILFCLNINTFFSSK